MSNKATTWNQMWLVLTVAVLFGGCVFMAWHFYEAAAKTPADFQSKLGDLLLQLAVIVVIGGTIKGIGEWFQGRAARFKELATQRRELAARARAAHVVTEQARELLRAHRSPKTYSEQMQRLIALRYEVEDLQADVKASKDLFSGSEDIIKALTGIVTYLQQGAEEYGPGLGHDHVDSGWESKQTFDETIVKSKMNWIRDFLEAGPKYQAYLKHLSNSKGVMRAQVYGA